MQSIREFWETYGMWITVMLIPTIITGLSLSPKTKKYAGILGKLWDAIKPGIALLSAATYKNQVGTFKLPLTKGPNEVIDVSSPKTETKPLDPSVGGPGCAALFMFVLLSAQPVLGCTWMRSGADKAKTVVIDCTVEAVKANAAHLLPVVMAILTGNAPNWKDMIGAFTKEMGKDAVACALQNAAIELQAKIPATGPDGSAETRVTIEAMQKARGYINDQGWQYKEDQ